LDKLFLDILTFIDVGEVKIGLLKV